MIIRKRFPNEEESHKGKHHTHATKKPFRKMELPSVPVVLLDVLYY